MVSDSELASRLHEFLSTSDLSTTTTATLRRKLEEHFGIALSDKKNFIREQIDLFLQTRVEKPQQQVDQEEEEDESGDEKAPVTRKRSKKKTKNVKKRGGGGGGGFTKVCSLSPQLQKFTGVPELPRTEVVKQIWIYIRENNLQDPSDRRNINCDDALRDLFNVASINMFQMNKALAKHIWPLDSDASVNSTPKEKKHKQEREGDEEEQEEEDEEGSCDDEARVRKRSKKQNKNVKRKGGSGFTKICSLSPQLQKFTGVPELPRTEVVKRMWNYIRENDLQDPSDRRNINCDDTLRDLFSVDSINMFQMNKSLAKHIWPLDSDASVSSAPKEKKHKQEEEEEEEEEEEGSTL